jgi:intracellular sulfur oxidation DsrE/DsrF family protein
MNRRNLVQSAALAASTTLLVASNAQGTGATAKKHHKVVIQVSDNDPAKWNLALNNAKNLQDDVGAANVDVEIVAYGPGIGMLTLDAPVATRVGDAVKSGIKVSACQNTMRGQKLTPQDMNPAIGYVPSGAAEIMIKQGEGWAYLRP